jgi:hypothetical protein
MITFTPSRLWPAHKTLFRQRIDFGTQQAAYVGGKPKGAQFVRVDGPAFIPAQSAPPKRGFQSGEAVLSDATKALVGKVWTIPGRVDGVTNGMQLREIDSDGNTVATHDILSIDPHFTGLHTLIETKAANKPVSA